jgi:hypothetical protein
MTTIPEYQKRIEEREIIKKEMRTTIIIGLSLILFTAVLGLISYVVKVRPVMDSEKLGNIWWGASLAVVLIIIAILGVRRTIYYSPKLIKDDFTLVQVLRKWRIIDTILLAVTAIFPVCGLVLTFLGMSFDKNFHFFVGAGLLMIILIPMEIKVRSKLELLRQHLPEANFNRNRL